MRAGGEEERNLTHVNLTTGFISKKKKIEEQLVSVSPPLGSS